MNLRIMVSAPYMLPFPDRYRRQLKKFDIEIVEIPVSERLSESDLLDCVENFDGAICGDDRFTEKVFRRAARLKIISKWGTGIDSIDLAAAAKYDVKVCNTPNAFTDAVADTTLGYILNFARRLDQMDKEIRHGLWTKPSAVALKNARSASSASAISVAPSRSGRRRSVCEFSELIQKICLIRCLQRRE